MSTDKIYLMADLHGNWKHVRDFHLRHNTNKEYNEANKTLIILGDFSANYHLDGENGRDASFKKHLGKFPFTYFCLRGNHEQRPSILAIENPDKWHTEDYFDGMVWVENEYSYIKYAADSVNTYRIGGYRALTIPGAYSVDKYYRLQKGWQWFPQEQLTQEEMKDGINLIYYGLKQECDIVLSHTCPIMFEPTDIFISTIDQAMVDKSMERYLGSIEYNLQYKIHLWGHFHQYREYPRKIGKPWFNNPRQLMLFNDYAVELEDAMTNENLVNKL